MKIKSILHLSLKDLGQSLFDEIITIYPDDSTERFFHCELCDDDPQLRTILDLLRANKFVPKSERPTEPSLKVFALEKERIYNTEDLNSAAYVRPTATHDFDVEYRDNSGRIMLESTFMKGTRRVGFASMSLIVSAVMRRKLEISGFLNLIFRPVLLDNKMTDDWWELTSELIMPPVSPPCEVIYFNSGKPFTGDYTQSLAVRENGIKPTEFHYKQREILVLEPFDCGRTKECFGGAGVDRAFIISNRLYRFLEREKAKLKWTPVRIDPD
jgi:hypothetical protein